MQVRGRKILDYNTAIDISGVDEIIITQDDGAELVFSLYRIRQGGRFEVRANDGTLVVHPRASNVIECESKRH